MTRVGGPKLGLSSPSLSIKTIEFRVCVYLDVALCPEGPTFQEWLCEVDTALVHVHPRLDIVERIAHAIERPEKVVVKQFLSVGPDLQSCQRDGIRFWASDRDKMPKHDRMMLLGPQVFTRRWILADPSKLAVAGHNEMTIGLLICQNGG